MTSTEHSSERDEQTTAITVFSSDTANTGVLSSAREAWRYRAFIGYMTRRELRIMYLRSYFGWVWSLVNPIVEVAIYTFVFGYLLQISRTVPDAPNGFNSFPHFMMSGIVTWGFYRSVSSKVLNNFTATVRLRRKLYFPPVAAALSAALATMVEASILIVVVTAFFALWGHISIHAVLILPAAAFAALSGVGAGLALSVANSRYKDVGYLYAIALRLTFYLLPIIWPIQSAESRFDNRWLEALVLWNPFSKMIEFGRDGLLYMRWPPLVDWLYLSGFSVGALLLGWWVFAKMSADVAEGL